MKQSTLILLIFAILVLVHGYVGLAGAATDLEVVFTIWASCFGHLWNALFVTCFVFCFVVTFITSDNDIVLAQLSIGIGTRILCQRLVLITVYTAIYLLLNSV